MVIAFVALHCHLNDTSAAGLMIVPADAPLAREKETPIAPRVGEISFRALFSQSSFRLGNTTVLRFIDRERHRPARLRHSAGGRHRHRAGTRSPWHPVHHCADAPSGKFFRRKHARPGIENLHCIDPGLELPDQISSGCIHQLIHQSSGKTYRIPGRHQTIVQIGIGLRRSHVRSAMILASCT